MDWLEIAGAACLTWRDLAGSTEVRVEQWQRRPVSEKVVGPFVWILERQQ